MDHSSTTDDATPGGAPDPAEAGQRGHARQWILVAVVALVLGTGGYAWAQVRRATSSPFQNVSYTVPKAPLLVASSGETVYRIDPTQSKVSYGIDEKIFGASAHHATGSTNGVAGDIAINPNDPSASRVAPIVINVEQFHSDNKLRDARVRQDFLQSHYFPLATFTTKKVTGLPAKLNDGQWYTFRLVGDLKVKKTTAPATWYVRGEFSGGKFTATATTKVKLSTFKAGPISIAGLVSTGDDVTLSFQLVALNPSKFTIPNVITGPTAAKKVKGGPSFKAQVLPVLEQDCAACHNAGQVGAAHWQLETAGDAAAIADGIRVITKARYMPPWPASDKGVPLSHKASLDQATIDMLGTWAADGGQLDVPESTPIKPSAAVAGLMPRSDVPLQMPKPYTGKASNPNDYRCFVLDPKFTDATFITGYSFQPDQITEIHHAQLFHITAEQVASSKAVDGKDGSPGWQCYAGPNLAGGGFRRGEGQRTGNKGARGSRVRPGGGGGQSGLIGGWAPGQTPVRYPLNSGVLFQPGDAIVMQIHYHYETAPTADQSSVSLETQPGTADVKQMQIVNPLAPVEIPCNPGVVAALCDRAAAIKDDVRLYGPSGAVNEAGLLAICGKKPEDLAATFKDGVASSTCTWPIYTSGTIVGVTGHMHTLGKSLRMTLDAGTPQQKILLDIPTWNFDWQMNYGLASPLHVKAGETVKLDCSWDRSLDPNRAPKYIVFAEGTEDEMCFSTYAFIPDSQP